MPSLAQQSVAQETADHEGMDHDAMEPEAHPSLFADLGEDIAVVKNKLLGLAEAIPEDAYDWRPGEGVRSIRETLLHVAADNYFIPMALGAEPPRSSGISGDYQSTRRFEEQALSKEDVIDAVQVSFQHLQRVLGDASPMSVGDEVDLFGRPSTVQKTWILTATHLHEHLGQMIAYARSNDVAPPWSM
jgi:uncharacterized damage-inducible protein DinB